MRLPTFGLVQRFLVALLMVIGATLVTSGVAQAERRSAPAATAAPTAEPRPEEAAPAASPDAAPASPQMVPASPEAAPASPEVTPAAAPQPSVVVPAPRPAVRRVTPATAPLSTNSASYRIHPGDVLNVTVVGEKDLSQSVTVLNDGTIQYPMAGKVTVADSTPAVAATTLRNSMRKFIRNPMVTVSVVSEGLMSVAVMGNVKTPGKYAVRAGARISDALAAAGGLGPVDGELPAATVSQVDGGLTSVSLQQLLNKGDDTQNIALSNNSLVYVTGPGTFHIEVLGAVDRPGYVDLRDGDRLSLAVARAGSSPNAHSDLNRVYITRTAPNGQTISHEINMYLALKGGDLRYNPVLKKGDVVFIPENKSLANSFGPGLLLRKLLGL